MSFVTFLMGACIVLGILAIYFCWTSHQNQLGWHSAAQRENVSALKEPIYIFVHKHGRLPRTMMELNDTFREQMPLRYLNPYSGELQRYEDSHIPLSALPYGDIRFTYRPAGEKYPAHIILEAYNHDGLPIVYEVVPPDGILL